MTKKRTRDPLPTVVVPLSRVKARLDVNLRATPIDADTIDSTHLHPTVPCGVKVIVCHLHTGNCVVLRPYDTALIGRSSASDIVVNDGCVSRCHCSIVMHGHELRISDFSKHGTFVNGTRISKWVLVNHNDIVTLGAADCVPPLIVQFLVDA
jgi:hypothetical protein